MVYAALGGALVTQCPEGSDRQITDLTTKINNVCGKALTEGEISYDQNPDGSIVFQLTADTDNKLGSSYADLCICNVPADFSAIMCTGAKDFNPDNTLLMKDSFMVDVDASGYMSMNTYSPLNNILALQNGMSEAELLDEVAEQAQSSVIEIDNQESDAANSARRTMNLYRDHLHQVLDADQMPVIMYDPSTGEIIVPGMEQGGCDTNGGLDPFGEPMPSI